MVAVPRSKRNRTTFLCYTGSFFALIFCFYPLLFAKMSLCLQQLPTRNSDFNSLLICSPHLPAGQSKKDGKPKRVNYLR